jgi:hypothetical protein
MAADQNMASDPNIGAKFTVGTNSYVISDNSLAVRREEGRSRLHVNIRSELNPGIANPKQDEVSDNVAGPPP